MENPATGNLKNRDVVKDLNFYDVDYCMYSDWGYRKRTRVWTNVDNFKPKRCDGSGTCGNMVMLENKKHLGSLWESVDNFRLFFENTIYNSQDIPKTIKESLKEGWKELIITESIKNKSYRCPFFIMF